MKFIGAAPICHEGSVNQQIAAVPVIIDNGHLLTLRLLGKPGTVLPGGKVRGAETGGGRAPGAPSEPSGRRGRGAGVPRPHREVPKAWPSRSICSSCSTQGRAHPRRFPRTLTPTFSGSAGTLLPNGTSSRRHCALTFSPVCCVIVAGGQHPQWSAEFSAPPSSAALREYFYSCGPRASTCGDCGPMRMSGVPLRVHADDDARIRALEEHV